MAKVKNPKNVKTPEVVVGRVKGSAKVKDGKIEIDAVAYAEFVRKLAEQEKASGTQIEYVEFVAKNAPFMRRTPISRV